MESLSVHPVPNATILRPIRHPISFELVVSFFIKFVVIGSYCFSMVFRGGSRGRTCRPCRLVASKLAYSYKAKIFLYKGQIFSILFASHAKSFFARPYRGIGMKGSASTLPPYRFRCAMLTSGLRSCKMPCRAAKGDPLLRDRARTVGIYGVARFTVVARSPFSSTSSCYRDRGRHR